MTEIEVWAPHAAHVDLDLDNTVIPMAPANRPGWHAVTLPVPPDGYAFRLDGGPPRPDPRSRRQPNGVHAQSALDAESATFPWTDASWRGRPLQAATIYELHIGTFTPAGTFEAAMEKLDHLVALGIDFVEIMPVAAFNGDHGWGYDGVALWAVHEPYGGPEGLRRFVDACHARGLGVLLDVVYNHLGPSGNYLAEFGPYFNDAHVTPWGPAVNLDGPGSDEVRAFVIENALFWLTEHHIDGLRLDAVHALADTRAVHLLEELSEAVDALAARTGRHLHLIAETDRNDPRTVTERQAGGQGVHAQWSDDFHHALHSALTGERQGYYCDFGAVSTIAKVLTSAYFHNGTYSTFRARHHGRPVDTSRLDAARFVVSLQTHDQVGNRAQGDRIGATLSPGLRKVGAALLLTSPFTPQLFMGEEWNAGTPWQYFTSHPEPDLAAAVRKGRRAEFAAYGWSADDVPDPQDPATRTRSRLDWQELDQAPHADLLAWYRALIALRRAEPALTDPDFAHVSALYDDPARWLLIRRGPLRVAANLSPEPRTVPVTAAEILLTSSPETQLHEDTVTLPPESVAVLSTDARKIAASRR
ncbi:MAG TPA: malto-oligosyltrehalose trehalohydrolase [Actinospica sp.]|nr:malto-oligosyltrehalose trehalohydrolase [Actinospica sp.]